MRVTLLQSICLLTLFSLAACGSGGPTTSDKDVQHVDYRQLEELLGSSTSKKPVVLVDLRSPEAVAKGRIPGSVHIPLAEVNSYDQRLAGAERVIVYHEDFKGAYADIAAKKLISGGVHDVYSYGGGYQDWLSRQAGGTPVDEKK